MSTSDICLCRNVKMLALYLGGFNSSLIIYYIFIVSSLFTHLFLFWSPPPPDGNIWLPTWFFRILSQKTKTTISRKQIVRYIWIFRPTPLQLFPCYVSAFLLAQKWSQLIFSSRLMRPHLLPLAWQKCFLLIKSISRWSLVPWTQLTFPAYILVLLWIRWKEEVSQLLKAPCLLCLFVYCLFLCSYKQCPGWCVHMNSGTISQGKA